MPGAPGTTWELGGWELRGCEGFILVVGVVVVGVGADGSRGGGWRRRNRNPESI